MRPLIYVTVLALLGCGASHETIDVVKLSEVLEQALPKSSYDLSLRLVEVERSGKDVIHCVLENTSAGPITIDASSLPWETPDFFYINAVTPGGDVLRRSPVISALSNPPRPVTIEVGKSLEGEFEVQYLPFVALPRSQDLLMLWSYSVVNPKGSDGHQLSGTLILRKR
jgi:hypothetical protein